mgnify:CR=1 FL=1
MTCRPKVVATIECRMGSSRLPGKIMMEAVDGISFLELIARRVSKCSLIDEIVLATTENTIDDAVEELSSKIGVKCFRGSEEDVLGRVLGAAKSVGADIIVELHGDCPFVDPDIISQVVTLYLNNQCDYAKNFEPSSYPDGLDAQAFSVDLLEEANRLGLTQEDREHVSWYFRTRPDVYKHLTIIAPESLRFPSVRLTLDTAEDLTFIKTILPKLYAKNENFDAADVVSELKALGII